MYTFADSSMAQHRLLLPLLLPLLLVPLCVPAAVLLLRHSSANKQTKSCCCFTARYCRRCAASKGGGCVISCSVPLWLLVACTSFCHRMNIASHTQGPVHVAQILRFVIHGISSTCHALRTPPSPDRSRGTTLPGPFYAGFKCRFLRHPLIQA